MLIDVIGCILLVLCVASDLSASFLACGALGTGIHSILSTSLGAVDTTVSAWGQASKVLERVLTSIISGEGSWRVEDLGVTNPELLVRCNDPSLGSELMSAPQIK